MSNDDIPARFPGTKITEIAHEGLKREFRIVLSPDDVESDVQKELATMLPNASYSGFRRGKVPMNVLRQREGENIRGVVISRAAREFAQQQIRECGRPVEPPVLNIIYESEELAFSVEFELIPEMPDLDFQIIELEREIVDDREGMIKFWKDHASSLLNRYSEAEDGYVSVRGDILIVDGTRSNDITTQKIRPKTGLRAGCSTPEIPDDVSTIGLSLGDTLSWKEELTGDEDGGEDPDQWEHNLTVTGIRKLDDSEIEEEVLNKSGFKTLDEFNNYCAENTSNWLGHKSYRRHRGEIRRFLTDFLDFELPEEYRNKHLESHAESFRPELGMGESPDSVDAVSEGVPVLSDGEIKAFDSNLRYLLYFAWYIGEHDLHPSEDEVDLILKQRLDMNATYDKDFLDRHYELVRRQLIEDAFYNHILERVTIRDKLLEIEDLPFPETPDMRYPYLVWQDSGEME